MACPSSSSSRNRRTCASSDTSQAWLVTRTTGGAPARAVAAASATAPEFRSHAATEQPCAASWRTSSRPMPEPPPVTTASLPVKDPGAPYPALSVSETLCATCPLFPSEEAPRQEAEHHCIHRQDQQRRNRESPA